MFKKWYKNLDSYVTAPLWVYLILIIVSCIAFVLTELSSSILGWVSIIKNMGYGIFGSTFVAALVDYATTRRKKEHDRNELFVLTYNLRSAANELIRVRVRYAGLLGKEFDRVPFNKWVLELPKHSFKFGYNGENVSMGVLISVGLKLIGEAAKSLKEKSVLLIDNYFVSETFFYRLDQLIFESETVFDENGKLNTTMFNITIEDILKCIAFIIPEYHHVFFDEWNAEEMNKKYRSEDHPLE